MTLFTWPQTRPVEGLRGRPLARGRVKRAKTPAAAGGIPVFLAPQERARADPLRGPTGRVIPLPGRAHPLATAGLADGQGCSSSCNQPRGEEAMTKQERFDIHQHITDQIVAAIERGAGEFRLPWHRSAGNIMRPVNVASKKAYRGVNILALWATAEEKGFKSGTWGTLSAMGRDRRAGEEGRERAHAPSSCTTGAMIRSRSIRSNESRFSCRERDSKPAARTNRRIALIVVC